MSESGSTPDCVSIVNHESRDAVLESLRALADEAVLRERELVARRERVLVDVVRERAQRYLQTRTLRPAVSLRPDASTTVAVRRCVPLRSPAVFHVMA